MAKVGELTCKQMKCAKCPFLHMPKGFCLDFKSNLTMFEGFELNKRFMSDYKKEQISKILNGTIRHKEVWYETIEENKEGNETNE